MPCPVPRKLFLARIGEKQKIVPAPEEKPRVLVLRSQTPCDYELCFVSCGKGSSKMKKGSRDQVCPVSQHRRRTLAHYGSVICSANPKGAVIGPIPTRYPLRGGPWLGPTPPAGMRPPPCVFFFFSPGWCPGRETFNLAGSSVSGRHVDCKLSHSSSWGRLASELAGTSSISRSLLRLARTIFPPSLPDPLSRPLSGPAWRDIADDLVDPGMMDGLGRDDASRHGLEGSMRITVQSERACEEFRRGPGLSILEGHARERVCV